MRQAPDVPHAALGRVAFTTGRLERRTEGSSFGPDLGADAIINLQRTKCSEMGWRARQVTGLAVRVEDGDAQKRLRWKWYAEEVSALTRGMLVILVVQVTLFFLSGILAGQVQLTCGDGRDSLGIDRFGRVVIGFALCLAARLGCSASRISRWRELLRRPDLPYWP